MVQGQNLFLENENDSNWYIKSYESVYLSPINLIFITHLN